MISDIFSKIEREIKELVADCEHHRKYHEKYAAENVSLRNENIYLECVVKGLTAKVDGSKIAELETCIQGFTRKTHDLEHKLITVQHDKTILLSQIDKLQAKLSQLEKDLSEKEKTLEAFRTVKSFIKGD